MNKNHWKFLLIAICFYQSSFAQTPTNYKFNTSVRRAKADVEWNNILSINPAVLFTSTILKIVEIKYERKVSNLFTLAINPTYYNLFQKTPPVHYGQILSDGPITKNLSLNSLNVWIQGRFYLSSVHDAPKGFFIAPEVSIGFLNGSGQNEIKTYEYNSLSFNTGLVVGYQWLIKKRFVIDAFCGVTKYYLLNKKAEDIFKTAYSQNSETELILPSWGFSLGYFF